MPVNLSRGDRNLLLFGGGVFLLLLAITVVLTGDAADRAEHPTTHSAGSTGAKAAYLLLGASGYQVERWVQSPTALIESTDPARTTLILAEPFEAPTKEERHSIQQFLERGGRVIATGLAGSSFLASRAEPDPVGGLTWQRVSATTPTAITRAAPEITLAPRASWNPDVFAVPLYSVNGTPVVVHIRAVEGDAFWWASATPLTNAGLREPGNLEFFLACLGRPDQRRVLFDEYFHGARQPLVASVMRSPIKWLLVQLAVLAAAILLTFSRRSGPIILPASETRLSPLEFVRTLGSLYQRAGAASVAVDIADRRFRFWLTRRLGVAMDTPLHALERGVRDRWSVDSAAVAATLRRCEAARENADLDGRTALSLVRSLGDHATALRLFHGSDKESR
jgi:hypothetical protein